ncbi:GNAT family N-acetyltransferase [Rathayibacter caricis DSM 15933]|uniref:GNAT family N-acetyltransferase n=1 Tax=Rathayibacter caricis DSM 15933 TaxID=1328867 RepID=A0A2T4UNY8_9MICO|nr:GNAT family N-acetyltransferase [Rathayibacter caricis]PTL71243.1 GNAT family N-acetyltransferase [Rathayibacter caricis DSM 15933]
MLDRLNLPASLFPPTGDFLIRRATGDDLPSLLQLLLEDPISAARGDALSGVDHAVYATALERVTSDPGNDQLVVIAEGGDVVASLQLTLIPGLARKGSTRLLVEAVLVASERRSAGIGSALMQWVTERAAIDLDASIVQLTSDAARTDARRFYQRLGFTDSHVGFKYHVPTR